MHPPLPVRLEVAPPNWLAVGNGIRTDCAVGSDDVQPVAVHRRSTARPLVAVLGGPIGNRRRPDHFAISDVDSSNRLLRGLFGGSVAGGVDAIADDRYARITRAYTLAYPNQLWGLLVPVHVQPGF